MKPSSLRLLAAACLLAGAIVTLVGMFLAPSMLLTWSVATLLAAVGCLSAWLAAQAA